MFSYQINEVTQLRLLEYRYDQELYDLIDHNRDNLREWLSWVDGMRSAQDTKSFIGRTRKQWADHEGFTAGIFYKDAICGIIGFNSVNWRQKHISIGYWLGQQFQGKGIITQACAALVDHAFQEMNLHRVEIRTAVENFKSRAVPERLGFKEEGIARQSAWLYDQFIDHVVYGMLAEEWKARPVK